MRLNSEASVRSAPNHRNDRAAVMLYPADSSALHPADNFLILPFPWNPPHLATRNTPKSQLIDQSLNHPEHPCQLLERCRSDEALPQQRTCTELWFLLWHRRGHLPPPGKVSGRTGCHVRGGWECPPASQPPRPDPSRVPRWRGAGRS